MEVLLREINECPGESTPFTKADRERQVSLKFIKTK